MMARHIFLTFLLAGCFANRASPGVPVGDTSMTGSPCMDGIMGNMIINGCESFNVNVIEVEQSILNMSCSESDSDNFWTSSVFYSTPANGGLDYPELKPVCFDMFVSVYTNK